MRCCASPTTFTAPSAERQAAQAFAALLYQSVFAPLGRSLGFYGELVTAQAASAVAATNGDALSATLERVLRIR